MPTSAKRPGLLLIANYDSDVGYAWWLMESFWAALAKHYTAVADVHLAYPSISKVPAVIEGAPITLHTCDFDDPSQRAKQTQLLTELNIKTLYFSDWPLISPRYALWRWQGVKTIMVHDHAPGTRTPPSAAKLLLKKLLHRLPLLNADAAFGASHFVSQRHVEINGFPKGKCFAAPNGLPKQTMPPPANCHQLFNIPTERKIIITTGRIQRYKNLGFALDVMAALAQQRDDFHYLLCGDGPDKSLFEDQARKLGISDRVTFAGRRSDIDALLLGSDIGFQPSLGEVGYSLSILEYMRAGLPVQVSDNPSVCEATTDNEDGMIYREGDTEHAVSQLQRLLQDTNWTGSLGDKARANIAAHYQLSNTHAAILKGAMATDPLLRHQAQSDSAALTNSPARFTQETNKGE